VFFGDPIVSLEDELEFDSVCPRFVPSMSLKKALHSCSSFSRKLSFDFDPEVVVSNVKIRDVSPNLENSLTVTFPTLPSPNSLREIESSRLVFIIYAFLLKIIYYFLL